MVDSNYLAHICASHCDQYIISFGQELTNPRVKVGLNTLVRAKIDKATACDIRNLDDWYALASKVFALECKSSLYFGKVTELSTHIPAPPDSA